MHLQILYPLVHKHHHRQALPFRGYFDAGNEHPIEQVIGLSCVWFALRVTQAVVGELHSATVILFFVMYALTAMLNHHVYDVSFHPLFGLGYSVRFHEMHHRLLTCNYAQNTDLFDKWFNTYREYTSGQKNKEPSLK